MSNRVKLAAISGALLLALVVVTLWYARDRTPPGAAMAVSGAADNLSAARKVSDPPAMAEPAAAPPTEVRDDVGIAAPAKPEIGIASRSVNPTRPVSKPKRKTAEPETDKARAASDDSTERAAAPPAPPPLPSASAPAAIAQVESGVLVARHHNSVGASLRLMKVAYLLDGKTIFSEDGAKLQEAKDLEVFNRRTTAGEHTLSVIATFQGNGHGVFSYFDSYRYMARSEHRFLVREKGVTQLSVTLLEKSGPLTAIENRLAIAFKVD
jgi:hypothetical protein